MINTLINMMEKGHLPDAAIRLGIRRLCHSRLSELSYDSLDEKLKREQDYKQSLLKSPLAIHTKSANEQHYELPPSFFKEVLGTNLKYSSGFWNHDTRDLSDAEHLALTQTMERAEIENGMRILELGCGWGSLTLAMAKKFPDSKIVAISNSNPQREYIQSQLAHHHLKNVMVLTRDISQLDSLALEFESFHRVVSVEMFEHFKNYEILLHQISKALMDGGKLFVHIFTHKEHSYPFEVEGEDNWMGKYFFTGGQMPSHYLLYEFQKDLRLESSWAWSGIHYQKTAEAWLKNMDDKREILMPTLRSVYGEDSEIWFQRWRIFFMSCGELFGYQSGSQWGVSHYLFKK
ncbi:MAG: class I SAM-dependent methyltransferase [Bacteriovoracaceae bacterium]|nr:class I SAM-dependent methyltransferase [Bacteriovoracaceae bacterium]